MDSSATSLNVGFFQTLELLSDDTILIRDKLYGDHTILEPILVELLHSPTFLRLTGICQYGVTALLGFTPRVTRFEHSVGAFLLVRKVGASLEEQVAALLHDVSHTVLSHVVDWALSDPPGESGRSFHEVHKARYIETTPLPEILTKHGFGDLKPLDEDLYPLVELSSPHLCADRLDYALRDAAAFGKLALKDVQQIFATLKAFSDAYSPSRLLVLEDEQLALILARAYLATDRDVWSNRAHIDLYQRTGQLIGDMIRRGAVKEKVLWTLSDQEFWQLLRSAADPNELDAMKRLESEGLPTEDSLHLPQGAKIRTLDPDVWLNNTEEPLPLSVVHPKWAIERQEYISNREATRV